MNKQQQAVVFMTKLGTRYLNLMGEFEELSKPPVAPESSWAQAAQKALRDFQVFESELREQG